MLRGLLNTFPVDLLMLVAASCAFAVVVLAVWLVRRRVPVTREGFHAEISAPMLGGAATLFGLLLAFVIVIGYQNFLDADASVSREADALASIVRGSEAFPAAAGAKVRLAVGTYVRAVVKRRMAEDARQRQRERCGRPRVGRDLRSTEDGQAHIFRRNGVL